MLETTAKAKMAAKAVIEVLLSQHAHSAVETRVGRDHGGRNLYIGMYTWISDYLINNATYPAHLLQHLFSVSRSLF